MGKKLLVIGGSGHAKDVIATARLLGYRQFQIVTTDGSCLVKGCEVIKEAEADFSQFHDWDCIAAIGDNGSRRRFHEEYSELRFVSIIAPSASVCDSAEIGRGSYIGAFVFVGPETRLGEASIVNAQSVVGHDARIGDYSHVGPKVCLSGHVELGAGVFVGAGATFNNGSPQEPLTVADEARIGMGCAVTASIKRVGAQLIPKPNHICARRPQSA